MQPFKANLARLLEQLSPTLPGSAAEVVRAALDAVPGLARPGLLPDLAALRGRGAPPHRPPPEQPEPGSRFTAHAVTTDAGRLDYKLFEPGHPRPPTELVVMLHGCTQTADDFAAGTRMNALAQVHNLLVAYPEQGRAANPSRCWNWFLPRNQRRGEGEPAALEAVIRAVMATHGIAPGRIMVAGLSAGGAMAAIMADAYPDLVAVAGIHSGLPVGAARDVSSAFAAMRHAAPHAAGETIPMARGVPTIVFHGDADITVDPANAASIVARLHAREAGLRAATEHGVAPNGRGWIKVTGRDDAGRLRFESWTVKGAPHAWSGGSAAGSYTDPSGPDASAEMVRFFREQVGTAAAPDGPRRVAAG